MTSRARGWPRDLHRVPESAFTEHQTSAFIARVLRELGYDVTTGIGGTGLVALLARGTSSRRVGLRPELDALPITEDSGVDYTSGNPGAMRASGHDGHMVMLLGAAAFLVEDGGFGGTVRALIQPPKSRAVGLRRWSMPACSSGFPSTGSSGSTTSPASRPGTCARAQGR